MKNTATRYGIIAAAIFVLWTLLEHMLGLNTTRLREGEITRMISAFVFYFIIFLCLRAEKKKASGSLTYMQGLKSGVLMVLVYSGITALWLVFYQHILNPNMHELMMEFTRKKMLNAGATPEEQAKALNEIDMVYSGRFYAYIMYFIFSSIIGTFVVALLALLMKSKRSEG